MLRVTLSFIVCTLFIFQTPAQAERLLVNSVPRGAKVYLKGVYKGVTPMAFELTPGRYHLELRRNGFLTWTTYMNVPSRADVSLRIRLEKGGSPRAGTTVISNRRSPGINTVGSGGIKRSGLLFARTNPSGVGVYANQRLLGYTPLLIQLPIGVHILTLKQAGFRTVTQSVTIQSSKSTKVLVKMRVGNSPIVNSGGSSAKNTQMMILSRPSGKVFLNGKSVGNAPVLSSGLPPGRYTVTIKRKGYTTYQRKIVLHPGQHFRIKAILVPSGRK